MFGRFSLLGRAIAGVLVPPAAVLIAACGGAVEETAAQERYGLQGEVVAVDPEGSTLTIAHEEIAGFMTAMTMPFNIRDRWVLDAAEPGSLIRAELVVEGTASWLEQVVVTKPAAAGEAAAAVISMAQPGEPVPVIAVVNQDGNEATLELYRGAPLLLTFIYTRCPLPDFCPRMSEHFDRVYDAVVADPQRYGDPTLMSISVDPAYDTPEILRAYGERYLEQDAPGGFDRWQFTRAEPAALKELAEFVGLRFMPERGEIIHSLRTAIIDAEGNVVRVFVGNSWGPEELLAALEASVAGASRR